MAAIINAVRERNRQEKQRIEENRLRVLNGEAPLPEPEKKKRDSVIKLLPPKRGGFFKYQHQAGRFYLSPKVQWGVAGLIGGNFCCNIVEKWIDPEGTKYSGVFEVFEAFFNVCFSLELALNMYGFWFAKFWKSAWNVFDVVVVSIGLLTMFKAPLPGPMSLLRNMRAFRVFRLFKRVKSLNKILVSLTKAVPGVLNACLILLIVMSIYAVLGVDFFQDYGEGGKFTNMNGVVVEYKTARDMDYGWEYFGNFGKSLFTMFQVLTGESWSEAVARPLMLRPNAMEAVAIAFYFTSYQIIVGIVLINVVVAVLLEKMVDEEPIAVDSDEEYEDEEEEEDGDKKNGEATPTKENAESPKDKEEANGQSEETAKVSSNVVRTDLQGLRTDTGLVLKQLDVLLSLTSS
eukprot:TRINITY_DN79355_c0_g1_i1.p1 TRINITY_DN79355_c0_g1~~TRINITY_DN79355_c0_g1_i1.p1  ORF type:complete len:403 (+),score=82.66 TRINITY_DN79355_c0_g1_i1:102-1310(+)